MIDVKAEAIEYCRQKMKDAGANLSKTTYEVSPMRMTDAGWEKCAPADAQEYEVWMTGPQNV
jgi:hypothetical protein